MTFIDNEEKLMENGDKAKNGKSHEVKIAQALLSNNIVFREQVRGPEWVGYTDNVDFVVETANGVIYVHATTDFFEGTYQVNRLEHAYQMAKANVWKTGEVFCCLKRPYIRESKRKTVRQERMKSAFNFLKASNIVGSTDDLITLVKTLNGDY